MVNTHYHLDHTGGNAAFAEAGATILAHRNLRAWERTENLKFFKDPKPEERAMVESLVLPDMVYSEAVDLYLGSRLVQVRYMLGHTGGDSVVIVPDADVVFGGDLVWQKHLPNLIDASTAPWIRTLDKLLRDLAQCVQDQRRQARFRCVLAVARDGKLLKTFTGDVEGKIAKQPRGHHVLEHEQQRQLQHGFQLGQWRTDNQRYRRAQS